MNEKSTKNQKNPRQLNDKQKEFCAAYMTNFNATQAYLKTYNCTYSSANAAGSRLLGDARVQKEIRKLKDIKNAALGNLSGEDVVELHMRIAFANMNDFAEFGGHYIPVMSEDGEPVEVVNPETKEKIPLNKAVNLVKIKSGNIVDGQLVNEVSVGRDGAKIKLADRQKSMRFLEGYFELNPSDRRKKEYDQMRGRLAGGDVSVNISVGEDEL